MQPWVGPDWRGDSLYSQGEWLRSMSVDKGVHVWIMTSWTKVSEARPPSKTDQAVSESSALNEIKCMLSQAVFFVQDLCCLIC